MRILQVTEASGAGTLRIVETLCSGLARRGHEVVLAYGRRPETPDEIGVGSHGGFDLEEIDWDRRSVVAHVRAARQLRRLVRRVRPDIIHLHSTFAGLVGGALDRRHRRVYTPHGWASTTTRHWRSAQRLGSVADRFAIRRSDLVGVVSRSEADIGRRLGARRLAVVPNGVPELDAPLRPTTPTNSPPVVVAGGRLVAARRPVQSARILQAIQDVAETRWIGDGHPGSAEQVRALGVEVSGWLPHHEAVDRIASADAYLHWSACDGQSVAVLEAIARDVVVIGSDVPPNRELLDPAQLFTSEQDAALMLRRVLESPDLRNQLIASQRRRGSTHGAERMVQGWIDAYEETVGARAAVRPS
jgi:glycosyltransferase involved in cell wall biosynthesis